MAIQLNTEDQKKHLNYFKAVSDNEGINRSEYEDNLQEWWMRHFGVYSCKKDKEFPFKGSADIQTGVIQYSDSTIESRFNAALNSLQFVKITGQSTAGNIAAKHCENFLNNYWKKKARVEDELVDYFQNIVVEGTGFLKILPTKNKKKVKRYKLIEVTISAIKKLLGYKKTGKNELETELIDKEEYIGCKWETVPSKYLKFDSSAKQIQKCSWIEHTIWLSESEINNIAKEEDGWIKDNITKLFDKQGSKKEVKIPSTLINTTPSSEDEKRDYQGFTETVTNKYELKEVVAVYDINGDGIDESCYFIFSYDKNIMLCYTENKFFDERKPFVSSPFYRISNKIIGQGLPQRLASLNDELDTLHDQIIDNNTLTNTLNGFYVPNMGYDPEKAGFKPGLLRPIKSAEGIFKFVELGNKQLNLQTQENFILGLLERKSLVADYSMGRESSVNKQATASGTAMLIREFGITLDPLIRNIQNSIKEAIYQTLQCFYETMPEDGVKYFQTNEKDEKEEFTFKREYLEFIDEMDISVLAGAVNVMVDAEKQIAGMLYQLFGQDQTGEVDVYEIKKNLVEVLDPKLVKRIMRTPEEVQLLQAMKQKAEQLAMLEQQLNQQMSDLQQQKQSMIIEDGKKSEAEFETKLRTQGLPEPEIQKALDEYRTKFIQSKLSPEEMATAQTEVK